jgi:hypothetical protein
MLLVFTWQEDGDTERGPNLSLLAIGGFFVPIHQHQKNLHLVAFSACGDGWSDYFLTHQANNRTQ